MIGEDIPGEDFPEPVWDDPVKITPPPRHGGKGTPAKKKRKMPRSPQWFSPPEDTPREAKDHQY
jgi:hypothetical protein